MKQLHPFLAKILTKYYSASAPKKTLLYNPAKITSEIRLGRVRDLARKGNCLDIAGEYNMERDVFYDSILMEKLHIPYFELYDMDYEYFITLITIITEKNRFEAMQQQS